MVAAYLLNPGRRGLGLKELAFENLGVIMTPISDLIGTGKKQITMAQVPIRTAADYAGADADMTLRLHAQRWIHNWPSAASSSSTARSNSR